MNSTNCVYLPETKVLKCKGSSGDVECDVAADLSGLGSKKFNVFGIGRLPVEMKDAKPESIKYWLYPRNIDNQTYFNHSIAVEGKLVDLVLYHADKVVDNGLRVPDLKCYERLVSLFNASTENHIVRLEGEESSSNPEVSLFGEILWNDKNLQKDSLECGASHSLDLEV